MPFYEEPEIPEALSYVIPKGKGYYALTRHAHIAEASRHPEIFQSGTAPPPSSTCPRRCSTSSDP